MIIILLYFTQCNLTTSAWFVISRDEEEEENIPTEHGPKPPEVHELHTVFSVNLLHNTVTNYFKPLVILILVIVQSCTYIIIFFHVDDICPQSTHTR